MSYASQADDLAPEEWISAAQDALKDAALCLGKGKVGGAGSYSWEAREYLMMFEKAMAGKECIPLRADFYRPRLIRLLLQRAVRLLHVLR